MKLNDRTSEGCRIERRRTMNNKPVMEELEDNLAPTEAEETPPKQAISSEKPQDVKPSTEEVLTEVTIKEEVPEKAQETVSEVPQTDQEPPIVPAAPIKVPRPTGERGRPRLLSDEKRKATQIFLTDAERALATQIGRGQMSKGVRFALDAYKLEEPKI